MRATLIRKTYCLPCRAVAWRLQITSAHTSHDLNSESFSEPLTGIERVQVVMVERRTVAVVVRKCSVYCVALVLLVSLYLNDRSTSKQQCTR